MKPLILARLRLARADLDEVLARFEAVDLIWAPAEGMRTLGGQLKEIAGTELAVVLRLERQEKVPFKEADALCERGSLDDYRTLLSEIRGRTLALLERSSEEELMAETNLFEGWHESLGFPSVPVAEVFSSIAQHEAYHTGQLVSYAWARGEDPYKW